MKNGKELLADLTGDEEKGQRARAAFDQKAADALDLLTRKEVKTPFDINAEIPYVPLNDRVLLRLLDDDDPDTAGIIMPETFKKKPNKALVVAVGEGRLIGGLLEPMDLEKGDVVLYARYAGTDAELDGEKFLIIRYAEIHLKAKRKSLVAV